VPEGDMPQQPGTALYRVARIVGSYARHHQIGADQLAGLIGELHRALASLGRTSPSPVPEPLTPAVPIRRSVQRNYVVCLECGYHAQVLRRHLRVVHDLEVAVYRRAAGNCPPITRSPRLPIRSGVRRRPSKSVSAIGSANPLATPRHHSPSQGSAGARRPQHKKEKGNPTLSWALGSNRVMFALCWSFRRCPRRGELSVCD